MKEPSVHWFTDFESNFRTTFSQLYCVTVVFVEEFDFYVWSVAHDIGVSDYASKCGVT